MAINSTSAVNLANAGVNLEITPESNFSSTTVEKLIKIIVSKNSHITIHVANYASSTLDKFAKLGGPNVTIVV